MQRDYVKFLCDVERARPADARRCFVDLVWEHFGGSGAGREVSWVGFYEATPDRTEMVLTHRRDKPACSPIGLQGMCGRGMLHRKTYVVRDVATLGEGYIACDPLDKSELVMPLLDSSGECSSVLDLDSYVVGAFSAADVPALHRALSLLGLTQAREAPEVVRL